MSNQHTEVSGYDLGSTGTIAEIQTGGGANVGWRLTATGSADFAVDIRGNDVGWKQVDSYTGASDIDDGKTMPEALRVRVRNTSTNSSETADLLLGVDD
jgi:hypothetical protein